jgi:hypothetical protein
MLSDEFKSKYSLPETPGISRYDFSLDGGGRNLVTTAIDENNIKLMLELGCFLCGSTRLWLEHDPNLIVVGIDPWEGDWATPLRSHHAVKNPKPWRTIPDREAFLSSVEKHGPFLSAMANVQEFKDRFFPVPGFSPEKLYEIKELGVNPELIYFDADKKPEHLEAAHTLWPDAILTGDDWTWNEDKGFPARQVVQAFAEKHGFVAKARGATWILRRP